MEEWMFLPSNLRNAVKRKQIYFSKNFVLIGFHPLYYAYNGHDFLQGTGDILILNLVSRKNFWMQTEIIKHKVRDPFTAWCAHRSVQVGAIIGSLDKVRAKMPSVASRIDDIRRSEVRWMLAWSKKDRLWTDGTDGIWIRFEMGGMSFDPEIGLFSVSKYDLTYHMLHIICNICNC